MVGGGVPLYTFVYKRNKQLLSSSLCTFSKTIFKKSKVQTNLNLIKSVVTESFKCLMVSLYILNQSRDRWSSTLFVTFRYVRIVNNIRGPIKYLKSLGLSLHITITWRPHTITTPKRKLDYRIFFTSF